MAELPFPEWDWVWCMYACTHTGASVRLPSPLALTRKDVLFLAPFSSEPSKASSSSSEGGEGGRGVVGEEEEEGGGVAMMLHMKSANTACLQP